MASGEGRNPASLREEPVERRPEDHGEKVRFQSDVSLPRQCHRPNPQPFKFNLPPPAYHSPAIDTDLNPPARPFDSERMYKARLSQWGISKNYSDKDYQICSILNDYRQKSGKRSTAFMVHGHKRSLKDLHKYVKGRKMTEEDFLASALANVEGKSEDQQPEQYGHVRAYTPDPEADGDEVPTSYAPAKEPSADIAANPSKARLSPTRVATESTSTSSDVSGRTSSPAAPTSLVTYSPTLQKPSTRTKALLADPLTVATQMTPSAPEIYGTWPVPKESHGTWSSNSLVMSRDQRLSPSQGTPPSGSHFASNELLANFDNNVGRVGSFDDNSSTMSCPRLGRDVGIMAHQIVDAPPLRSQVCYDDMRTLSLEMSYSSPSEDGMDYEQICPTCHESTREHFVSLPNLETPRQSRNILNVTQDAPQGTMSVPTSTRQHDHSWRWVARCFAACIYLRRRNNKLSRRSLEDADAEFERMLVPRQDPKVLLALNQTLQILQMHDQGEITKTIIASACDVAVRLLGHDDPLTTILRWMVYVANGQMENRDITSSTIGDVHEQFVLLHGYEDPRSIASKYCYGYMLNVEGNHQVWKLSQAEQVLREVYDVSSRVFGPCHLQSISALTNLHRSLQRQGRIDEAITVLKHAIHDSKETLGENHPRRLESRRLLALLYQQQGRLDRTEELYWIVLEGRIKMLGKNHTYTLGMKQDLEKLLEQRGRWTVKRKVYNSDAGHLAGSYEEVEVQSAAQLRIQDLFEWDHVDNWDEARSEGGESYGTGSEREHAAF